MNLDLNALRAKVPAEFQDAFVRFIEKNELDDAFLAQMDRDTETQRAVDEGLRLKAAALDEFTREKLADYLAAAARISPTANGAPLANGVAAGAEPAPPAGVLGLAGRVVHSAFERLTGARTPLDR